MPKTEADKICGLFYIPGWYYQHKRWLVLTDQSQWVNDWGSSNFEASLRCVFGAFDSTQQPALSSGHLRCTATTTNWSAVGVHSVESAPADCWFNIRLLNGWAHLSIGLQRRIGRLTNCALLGARERESRTTRLVVAFSVDYLPWLPVKTRQSPKCILPRDFHCPTGSPCGHPCGTSHYNIVTATFLPSPGHSHSAAVTKSVSARSDVFFCGSHFRTVPGTHRLALTF